MELKGLTPEQMAMCDEIWACETQEDIMSWFDQLEDGEKFEAWSLIQLMTIEQLDMETSHMQLSEMIESEQIISKLKGQ
jgi:hypothetical protein